MDEEVHKANDDAGAAKLKRRALLSKMHSCFMEAANGEKRTGVFGHCVKYMDEITKMADITRDDLASTSVTRVCLFLN